MKKRKAESASPGRKRKARPRKPRDLYFESGNVCSLARIAPDSNGSCYLIVTREYLGNPTSILYSDEARRLAAWLLKFSEWSEYREKKRGKV